jgi:hypothetical protein
MATSRGPSKADLEELIETTYESLQEAFDPRLSREEMTEKIGDIIDALAPEDEADEDEDDDSDDDEDEERARAESLNGARFASSDANLPDWRSPG